MATRPGRAQLGPALAVAAATWLSGAFVFGLLALSAWDLGPEEFGVVAVLLAVVTVAFVAALGLQATVARSEQRVPVARTTTWRLALVVTALTATVMAALSPFLQLPAVTSALAVAVAIGPLVLLADPLGRVQGREQFSRLGRWLLLSAALRVIGGVPGLLTNSGLVVVVGTGIGSALAVVILWRRAPIATARVQPALPSVLVSTAALAGVLLLANLDVVLGRSLLSEADTGLYAAGALVAKAAFWAPSFLVVLALPAFADPVRRQPTLVGVLIATSGLVLSIAGFVALFPRLVLPFIGGRAYEPVAGLLPVFALLGGSIALIQVVVYARIGREARLTGIWLTAFAVALAVAVAWYGPSSPAGLLGSYLAAVAVLTLVAVASELFAGQFSARASMDGQGPAE